jgi:hypothetical protein
MSIPSKFLLFVPALKHPAKVQLIMCSHMTLDGQFSPDQSNLKAVITLTGPVEFAPDEVEEFGL